MGLLKKKGYLSIGNFTIYGRHTAMRGAINLYTKKYGYICLRLPYYSKQHKEKVHFYLYFSPNATPWAATFMIGRKYSPEDWALSRIRYNCFGHNFDIHGLDKEYNMTNYTILSAINDVNATPAKWFYQDHAIKNGYYK